MKHLLITGGTGTIGRAFVREYRDHYQFFVLGHSEKRVRSFLEEFPEIPVRICAIEDPCAVARVFEWADPDVVVHAAAIKHVDFAERQPFQAVNANIVGSLNVLDLCSHFYVPSVVAISTDKAADPHSVYGYTKKLMEDCFVESGYAACRFGNVVGSAGSVVPLWKSRVASGKPLLVTHPEMRRFMFTIEEAVELIHRTITRCQQGDRSFILTKLLRSVWIMDLAKKFSEDIELIGVQPGERLDECLISEAESEYCTLHDNIYVRIGQDKPLVRLLKEAYTTNNALPLLSHEIDTLLLGSSGENS